jgi:predicted TIM-barrel fold metal-dependent hydrolase
VRKKPVKIDVHVHLAGAGCCGSGCWVAPRFERRYTFRLLRWFYRIDDRQMRTTVDRDFVRMIAERVAQSELDYAVALGFDAVFDAQTGEFDVARSQLMVPDEWVFRVCRETPGLLPGPSINPYRRDALKRLERAIDNGAVLLKWLPAAQGIDPGDPRLTAFYRTMAQAGLPLLVHMGGERTFVAIAPQFNDVLRLHVPLDQGVKVICAHSATPPLGARERDQSETLKQLLREYPRLWVDNSGLCNPSRFHHVRRLARDPLMESRTLYGSDWPVPPFASFFIPYMGVAKFMEIERIKNCFDRDVAIKRHFGYTDQTLTRASTVLANLDQWIR